MPVSLSSSESHAIRHGLFYAVFVDTALAFAACLFSVATLRAQPASYIVLSSQPNEVVVRVQPHYSTETVYDTSGYAYTAMSFPGGVMADSAGTQGIQQLHLMLLAPNRQPARIQIMNQSLEVLPDIDLAPIPTIIRQNGNTLQRYIVRDAYYTSPTPNLFEAGPVVLFRTAFAEQITVSPIAYDPGTRTVTRVKSLTLRIQFSGAGTTTEASSETSISPEEASTFSALFLNGAYPSLYACAYAQHAGFWKTASNRDWSNGNDVLSVAPNSGQWLEITTNVEGVYRITAQDLTNAGITGAIDPNSIELLGYGGAMLNEAVTATSGEWSERPIEVHANGSSFQDLYFYAPGAIRWNYRGGNTYTDGVAHTLNPYTSSGHFLLHVGGTPVASVVRIAVQPDSLNQAAIPASSVLTATAHDIDHTMEYQDVGREMLDQSIPRADQPPLSIALDAPGFVGGSSVVRVAWDGAIGSTSTDSPGSGYVTVQLNGQTLGMINGIANTGNVIDRNWDTPFILPASVEPPLNLSLSFTSTSVTATSILDYVELVYHRSLDIGSASIPFMLIDTNAAFQCPFTDASGGEVWDVTDPMNPHIVAVANGNSMPTSLQGQIGTMRRFIAFSGQSLLTPDLTAISAPSLRNTVCQTGAAEIIIAPQQFLAQADSLAALREEGGQATEPMSAIVVTMEDIYREFGYGNNDIVALRDFMAYTFRHAKTRPSYLTLLGGGHCDYQNRETSTPNWIPFYEDVTNTPYPDDDFFVQLIPDAPANFLTLAVGRISARNGDDAWAYVNKVWEYEHASDTGSWRAITTFLADDHYDPEYNPPADPLNHFFDTQLEITHLQDRVLVHKIYEASYPTVITALGERRKPQVNTDIINAFNSGTVLFSFVGHGNPVVWTHESVLNVPSSIEAMTNFNRLAYVTTATCDFSQDDDFNVFSGGEQFLMNPYGGAIGLLGTSRSVTSGEPLVQYFYQTLFQADSGHGTSTVGQAMMVGKMSGGNWQLFYLLGDPAQRLLLPKMYVTFDSLNGATLTAGDTTKLAALSEAQVTGSIRPEGPNAPIDSSFNGNVSVTLYDTPTKVVTVSTFANSTDTFWDVYNVQGPVLFNGTATVTNGRFQIKFIVPRDIKLDSGLATLSGYAYSSEGARTALGQNMSLELTADTAITSSDSTGPSLKLWIGSRAFQSGDEVSCHTTAIVDVAAPYGVNTSTASIGHSFIVWVDNAMDSAVNMANTYLSLPNRFDSGSSVHAIELPAGHHTLHVRAFDTYDNPSFASVDFVAENSAPYHIYNVIAIPNPMQDHTTFSFVQPGQAGSLVNVTLSLYASDGSLIRVLRASSRESNIEIPWDGRDAGGTTVANGAYFFNVNVQDVTDGTSSIASGKCVVER